MECRMAGSMPRIKLLLGTDSASTGIYIAAWKGRYVMHTHRVLETTMGLCKWFCTLSSHDIDDIYYTG